LRPVGLPGRWFRRSKRPDTGDLRELSDLLRRPGPRRRSPAAREREEHLVIDLASP
jgi:hypothetical protein